MTALTEAQEDAVCELFNIGMGYAAAALSQMVGHEIALSVPRVNLLPWCEVHSGLGHASDAPLTGVRQEFSGAFGGAALLIFPEDKGLSLVRAMMHDEVPLDELTDLEQDALAEVGNVMLNTCLGTLANTMGVELETDLPGFVAGPCAALFAQQDERDVERRRVLVVRIEFGVAHRDVSGYVVLSLDVESLEVLMDHVEQYFLPA